MRLSRPVARYAPARARSLTAVFCAAHPIAGQPIASTGNGLQKLTVLPERLPYCRDVKLKRILFDHCTGPHSPHQFILVDEFTARSKEDFNDFESAAPHGGCNAAQSNFALGKIDLQVAERVHV
jgi:hypothetical protein